MPENWIFYCRFFHSDAENVLRVKLRGFVGGCRTRAETPSQRPPRSDWNFHGRVNFKKINIDKLLIFFVFLFFFFFFVIRRLILGNYLAQQGKTAVNKLKAALIISVPWNVWEATKSIEKPYLNLMLNKHLAGNLCRNVETYHYSTESGFFDIDIRNVLKVMIE